jgi:hypothetical protein
MCTGFWYRNMSETEHVDDWEKLFFCEDFQKHLINAADKCIMLLHGV